MAEKKQRTLLEDLQQARAQQEGPGFAEGLAEAFDTFRLTSAASQGDLGAASTLLRSGQEQEKKQAQFDQINLLAETDEAKNLKGARRKLFLNQASKGDFKNALGTVEKGVRFRDRSERKVRELKERQEKEQFKNKVNISLQKSKKFFAPNEFEALQREVKQNPTAVNRAIRGINIQNLNPKEQRFLTEITNNPSLLDAENEDKLTRAAFSSGLKRSDIKDALNRFGDVGALKRDIEEGFFGTSIGQTTTFAVPPEPTSIQSEAARILEERRKNKK